MSYNIVYLQSTGSMNSLHQADSPIIRIKQQINLFQQLSYQKLYGSCRQISKSLQYLCKLTPYQSSSFRHELASCMNAIHYLLQAEEFHKYGHAMPLLAYLANSYARWRNDRTHFEGERVLSRLRANEQSSTYQQLHLVEITANEKKCLRSDTFNTLITQLSNQQIVLPNPHCVCCSEVFLKDSAIVSSNPQFTTVVGLPYASFFNLPEVQRYFNAIINSGGGVIVIGAKRYQNVLKALGINFDSHEQIQQKENQIKKVLSKINPPCNYQLHRVLVHSNYADQQNIGSQHMRICFRVLVYPLNLRKVHYIETLGEGKSRTYEIYQISETQDPKPVVPKLISNKLSSFYSTMHQIYNKARPPVSTHANIRCSPPHVHYSKKLREYLASGYFQLNPISSPQLLESQGSGPFLKFKFQHTCLLVVSTQKNDRYVISFKEFLLTQKQQIELTRPFQNIFTQNAGVRSVWMLSYDTSLVELKKLLKMAEQVGGVKAGSVKILPVTSNLHVEKSKLSEYQKKIVHQKFTDLFRQPYQIKQILVEETTGQSVATWSLSFISLQEAIFTYLVLEEMHIWSYFVKEGTVYQKKAK